MKKLKLSTVVMALTFVVAVGCKDTEKEQAKQEQIELAVQTIDSVETVIEESIEKVDKVAEEAEEALKELDSI